MPTRDNATPGLIRSGLTLNGRPGGDEQCLFCSKRVICRLGSGKLAVRCGDGLLSKYLAARLVPVLASPQGKLTLAGMSKLTVTCQGTAVPCAAGLAGDSAGC